MSACVSPFIHLHMLHVYLYPYCIIVFGLRRHLSVSFSIPGGGDPSIICTHCHFFSPSFPGNFSLSSLRGVGCFSCSSFVICEALYDILCKKSYTNEWYFMYPPSHSRVLYGCCLLWLL